MLNTPFSPWPSFTQDEARAVEEVLLSNRVNYWTGEQCREFERDFAAAMGCEYAIAVSNGTVALELALRGLGIGPGDEVIVPSRTFLASASCIAAVGATPVFADVDRHSQNITPATIAGLITPSTRGIIAVHLAGWPCDMEGLLALSRNGIYIIEDCAQAHGARFQGQSVGTIGQVGCWSFCQDKIMTTGGEGGMVTTNDPELWRRMWSYKDHGKSWHAVYEQQHPPGFRWLHDSLGTNYRLTEMQAAIGRLQLQRLPEWSAARQCNATRIWEAASTCPGLRVPAVPESSVHAAYKCYVFVEHRRLSEGWTRDRILDEIVARGVPCYTGSCSEIYLEEAFDNTGWRPTARLPVARELGETSLMFLCHPTLTREEISTTCRVLVEVMKQAVDG